ncbi:hypothetical protein GH741_17920 [Aquibacillus halophilus]|uniref:Uncharacterized protein n=1 Tax=Aquibacillus halophilus TaxID=930132 RepID=A0A6A8DFP9_9BACI|nr:hypothetical protein [Aquibacillus halophilus]MRH44525.1 hypothetical protein [Aquibacillus halophilus]
MSNKPTELGILLRGERTNNRNGEMDKASIEKVILNEIPKEEVSTWELIKNLPTPQKKLLWYLIIESNKDGTTIYSHDKNNLLFLMDKGLIRLNTFFKSTTKVSVFVLRDTPYLMRALSRKR